VPGSFRVLLFTSGSRTTNDVTPCDSSLFTATTASTSTCVSHREFVTHLHGIAERKFWIRAHVIILFVAPFFVICQKGGVPQKGNTLPFSRAFWGNPAFFKGLLGGTLPFWHHSGGALPKQAPCTQKGLVITHGLSEGPFHPVSCVLLHTTYLKYLFHLYCT
jgi:hypothetical protein